MSFKMIVNKVLSITIQAPGKALLNTHDTLKVITDRGEEVMVT